MDIGFVTKIYPKGYGIRLMNEANFVFARIRDIIGKDSERDYRVNPFFHERNERAVTCVPRVFLNTVYGYREISVGVYRISPTDRSRFYVTDRGHSRKERSSFSLFLQAFSPRRYRIYCRPIATDNISPRLSNCFVPFSFSLFCLRNERRG